MPLCTVIDAYIVALDTAFEGLSIKFGKSPRDRDAAVPLSITIAEAADAIAAGLLKPTAVGLSIGTTNKHFGTLAQVHKFMRKSVPGAPVIDFAKFTGTAEDNDNEARDRYTLKQGEAIFRLAPWTGCKGTHERFVPSRTIIHDALFFLLLLVWYTGARREELCKLMLTDIESRHDIAGLLIRPTVMGRIKNKSAKRVVVLADELLRLGFIRYVEAMRLAGETLLFPELVPAGDCLTGVGTEGNTMTPISVPSD